MARVALKAWVGQQIEMMVDLEGGQRTIGKLDGVDDKGVILIQPFEEGGRPVFYSWRFVVWIHPSPIQYEQAAN